MIAKRLVQPDRFASGREVLIWDGELERWRKGIVSGQVCTAEA